MTIEMPGMNLGLMVSDVFQRGFEYFVVAQITIRICAPCSDQAFGAFACETSTILFENFLTQRIKVLLVSSLLDSQSFFTLSFRAFL